MTPQTFLKYIGGFAFAAGILFLVWYFSAIVIYILVSAVLAVMGGPLVARLSSLHLRGRRVPRWAAAMIVLLLMWTVFVLFCALFLPLVLNKLYELSMLDFGVVLSTVEEPIMRAQEYLCHLFGTTSDSRLSLNDSILDWLRTYIDMQTVNSAFSSIVGLAVSSVIAFFSVSFITFFFLREESLFFDMVRALFPERYSENVTRALESIKRLLARYFTGLLTESVLLMIVISLVMILFGMAAETAVSIGLIMGVMNVIPYAGPLIGGIVSVFMGVITPIAGVSVGDTMLIIVFTLLSIKCIDDFVIQPALYSGRVKAHPLEIFLVILIAGSMAGIVGMLLAIPMYTVLRVFAKEFFSQFSLVQKLTEKI